MSLLEEAAAALPPPAADATTHGSPPDSGTCSTASSELDAEVYDEELILREILFGDPGDLVLDDVQPPPLTAPPPPVQPVEQPAQVHPHGRVIRRRQARARATAPRPAVDAAARLAGTARRPELLLEYSSMAPALATEVRKVRGRANDRERKRAARLRYEHAAVDMNLQLARTDDAQLPAAVAVLFADRDTAGVECWRRLRRFYRAQFDRVRHLLPADFVARLDKH